MHAMTYYIHACIETDFDGIRHISKTNGMRERWIDVIKSIHWCATVPTTFTGILRGQVPTFWKTK